MKSGATAISSEMLFGEQPKQPVNNQNGRWSTPASLSALGEKIQDHIIVARTSMGSSGGKSMEEYKQAVKEKTTQIAAGAYEKASYAKHAALDWITTMTQGNAQP